jgi:hypothetical protein
MLGHINNKTGSEFSRVFRSLTFSAHSLHRARVDQPRFEDEMMTRIKEVLTQDTLTTLLRRLSRQLRTLARRAIYHPERRYMRGRRT